MGPDRGSPPFPLLQDAGIGNVDEPTDAGQDRAPPIPQLLDPPGDVR